MTEHTGSCLCGSVQFAIAGHLESFYICHCQHCKKDTGTAFAANLFSRSAQLTWLAGAEAVTSFTLPGTRHGKSFCQTCGSALPNTLQPGLLAVPAGCLDSTISLLPTAHIFTSRKAGWECMNTGALSFEELPE